MLQLYCSMCILCNGIIIIHACKGASVPIYYNILIFLFHLQDSQWTCKQKMNCPIIDCQPEHILFSEDGCCPVCARQAFGEELCESF